MSCTKPSIWKSTPALSQPVGPQKMYTFVVLRLFVLIVQVDLHRFIYHRHHLELHNWLAVGQSYVRNGHSLSKMSLQYIKIYWWLSVGLQCLIHMGVRDKCQGSEIDLSQPRHETLLWWHHNGPVTSQSTNIITWPIYPWHLIKIYGHIDTCDKVFLTPIHRHLFNCAWYISYIGRT